MYMLVLEGPAHPISRGAQPAATVSHLEKLERGEALDAQICRQCVELIRRRVWVVAVMMMMMMITKQQALCPQPCSTRTKLDKRNVWPLGHQLVHKRRNHAALATPWCIKVHH